MDKATVAMARLVYGIKDPANRQLALFLTRARSEERSGDLMQR
jgi:hypothetical protein